MQRRKANAQRQAPPFPLRAPVKIFLFEFFEQAHAEGAIGGIFKQPIGHAFQTSMFDV
jgi:hypothetical protein